MRVCVFIWKVVYACVCVCVDLVISRGLGGNEGAGTTRR